jgi:hypothetical protein
MRKRSHGALPGTSLAATVLATGLATSPSFATAASTWTVKPGGSFSGSSGQVAITNKTTKRPPITCPSSSMSGKIKSGSGLAGANIASITAWSFGLCGVEGSLPLPLTFGAFPYDLNAQSYDAASGETTATLTGIVGILNGFCTVRIAGTSSATPGEIKAVYTNSTHKLVISGGTLHIYGAGHGNECAPFLNIGDRITISATYAVTPAQTITSP